MTKFTCIHLALLLLYMLCDYVAIIQTAKIVIPGTVVQGMGHVQVLSTLSAELTQRGHHVTLLSGSEKCSNKFTAANASQIIPYSSPNATIDSDVDRQLAAVKFHDYSPVQQIDVFLRIYRGLSEDCRALLNDRVFLERLKSENFDILLGDMISPCDIFIAHLLDIPWIAATANRQYLCVSNSVYRIPSELSYVPQLGFHQLTDRMTFMQRAANVLFYMSLSTKVFPLLMQDFIEIKREYGIAPEVDIWEMSSQAEIWLSQTHWALDYPSPGLPNWVPVGGLGVRPANALPKDLEEFVDGSGEHGFIVFSLGSIIKWLPDAPETRLITSVLSKLPQRVVWKHDGPTPPNIGSNVKLMKWLPQNDLLGHPKVRLFIGHGGLNGVYEALHHAVPMVLIPLMLDDQKENAGRVASKRMGIHLDRSKLTEKIFYEAVTSVLNDTRYKKAVTHYSEILHDKPPLDTAVYWIEHVIKFGGAHLRPRVYELNFVQYYLIDVLLFFFSIAVSAIIMVIYLGRFLWRTFVRKSKKISKID